MAREVARGEIRIDVDDRGAMLALRHVDDEFNRAMDRIDREEATLDLNADTKQLKKDLKEAEKAVKDYERRVDEQQNKSAKTRMRRRLDQLRAEERIAKRALENEEQRRKFAERRIDAIEKAEVKSAKVIEQVEKKAARRREADARRRSTLERQRVRELSNAERAAHRMNAELEQEDVIVKRLQRRYGELQSRLVKLAESRRKARGDTSAVRLLDLKTNEAKSDMDRVLRDLRRRGKEGIDIGVHLGRGTDFGRHIRNEFERGGWRRAVLAGGTAFGGALGNAIGDGVRRTTPRSIGRGLLNTLERGLGRTGRVLEGLTNMTVRIGPFTATIRQLVTAMSLFAPLLVDVAGALGALVGSLGGATLGVGALGVALAGGALPALIGVVTVLKPMIQQFKDVTALSKAYNKAVLQYGKNSDQAHTALQKMNHALGSVDAQTRKAFVSAGTLGDRWRKLTEPSRSSAFEVMGQGLNFLNSNLRSFAGRTNETFAVLQKGMDRWIKGLNSPEGRNAIDTMWGNFNRALGPAIDGLGNIAAYLGRVGRIASFALPGLTSGFKAWSEQLLHTSDDTDALAKRVNNMINQARSWGRFFMSAGRLLKSFFSGSLPAGQKLVDTMTNALNRWTSFLQTAQGQQTLGDFFSRSVSGLQAFWSLLSPIISTFSRWAAMLAPFSAAFFRVSGAVANFVAELLRVTALQGPLSAIATTLGTLWAVGRISAAAQAITGFTSALLGMGAAATAVEVETAAVAASTARITTTGAVAQGALAATGATAATSAKKVGTLRAAATLAVPAIEDMGLIAGGAATLGVAALAAGAVYGAYKLATMKDSSDKLNEQMATLNKNSKTTGQAFKLAGSTLGDVGSQAQHAQLNLKAAREQLHGAKKGTDEYRFALLNYRDAQRQAVQAQQMWTTQSGNYRKAARDSVKIDNQRAEVGKQLSKMKREDAEAEKKYADATGQQLQYTDEHNKKLAALEAEYAKLTKAANRAANVQAAAGLNVQRAWRGMAVVTGQAEQSLGRLARLSRTTAARIAIKFDAPKDVGRVAANATRALRSGVPARITTRIVANSKDAEAAIRKLQRLTIDQKEVRILQRGGEQAVNMLERILGKKLTPKQQRIAERGGAAVISMLERIIRRRINDKNFSINARDNATSVVSGIIANINALPPAYIDVYIRQHGPGRSQLGPGMNASGGVGGTSAQDPRAAAAIARQAMRVDKRQIPKLSKEATQRGRKITGPTLLTGEERRTEFVIATNPRYRRQNMKHLRSAANALGADVMPAASGFNPKGSPGGFYPVAGKPELGQPKNQQGHLVGNKQMGTKGIRRAFKKKGARRKVYARQDAWAHHIASLHTQQDDWDREVGIREQAVIEPESFLKEVSRIPGTTLPDGSKTDDIVQYDIDQGVVAQFKMQLQSVKDAYDHLVDITNQLVVDLPRALNAADNEWRVRNLNFDKFKDARNRHRNIARNTKDDKVKAHHNKLADNAQKDMDAEKAEMSKLRDNESQYKADRKEAGFDEREYRLSSADYGRQIDAVSGRATSEKAQADDQGGGGGGGGGGGTPLSYGQQSALADAEKMGALRDFGANFANAVGNLGSMFTGSDANPSLGSPAGSALLGATLGALGAGGSAGMSGVNGIGGASVASSLGAAKALGGSLVASAGGGVMQGAAGGDTVVNVVNNYQTQPEDPHTWSKSMQFEVAAALG